MRARFVRMALVGIVLLACGGNQPESTAGSPENPEDVTLIVDNDYGSTIAVYVIFGSASARRLGNVSAGQERQFTVRWSGAGFATQIESVLDNRRVASNTINLPPGAIVHVEVDSRFRPKVTAYKVN